MLISRRVTQPFERDKEINAESETYVEGRPRAVAGATDLSDSENSDKALKGLFERYSNKQIQMTNPEVNPGLKR
jgi:hypothetical protein